MRKMGDFTHAAIGIYTSASSFSLEGQIRRERVCTRPQGGGQTTYLYFDSWEHLLDLC